MYYISFSVLQSESACKYWNIVESLQFVVTRFLWYSWIALLQEVKSSRKTILLECFFLVLKFDAFAKLHIHEKQKSNNQLKLAPTNEKNFTVIKHFKLLTNV